MPSHTVPALSLFPAWVKPPLALQKPLASFLTHGKKAIRSLLRRLAAAAITNTTEAKSGAAGTSEGMNLKRAKAFPQRPRDRFPRLLRSSAASISYMALELLTRFFQTL